MAAERAKERELLVVFNALRHDMQPELHGHFGQCADDGGAVFPRFDAAHERPIELQGIDRKLAKMRERGVAGAEIVDADANSRRAELHEQALDGGRILHRHALGQFEHEASRLKT